MKKLKNRILELENKLDKLIKNMMIKYTKKIF